MPTTARLHPFDQAELSAAFAAARERGRAEGEILLRQLRARQVARDLTADSFAVILPFPTQRAALTPIAHIPPPAA